MTRIPTLRALAGALLLVILAACGSSKSATLTGGMTGMHEDTVSAPKSATATTDAMAGMDHSGSNMATAMSNVRGDGTQATVNGYTFKPVTVPTNTGPSTLTFQIDGPGGTPIKDAVVEQTKKLHLIVVRSDLTGYQHIHPDINANGLWTVPFELPRAGRWHLIADVTPVEGERIVLGTDIRIAGGGDDQPLPVASTAVDVDGYTVTMLGSLTATTSAVDFTIEKDGAPATGVTAYLGAGGHLVALDSTTLAYTHLHPQSDAGSLLQFDAAVPKTGTYRLYLQFATGDIVHTAELTADVVA
jgi:hypothetical protein